MSVDNKSRERLIECAKKEFLEKGFAKASLRNICAQAGLTTGAVYFLFKDKNGLLEAVVSTPQGGEAAYVEGLDIQLMGYTLEVSVIGIDPGSKYFDADVEKGRSKAVINNSLAERLGYKKGDKVTFADPANDIDHTFTVTGIAEYSPGFTLFMDRQSMCELFGRDKDYFNAVYSDKQLDIEQGRLYSVTTKEEIKKSAGA